MNAKKIGVVGVLIALVIAFFAFDLSQYLTLDYLKSQHQSFLEYYDQNPAQTIGIFFLVYVSVCALSLPGAAILTLAGGALFGLVTGTIVVNLASTIGAALAFLASRFLIGETVQSKYGDRLRLINEGIEREGALYLLTLRLVPAIPYFIINLAMGLTKIRTLTFIFVSQVGMIPGTMIYVNAGTQLAQIEKVGDILSFEILISLVLLGVFPIITKKVVAAIKGKKNLPAA